MGPQRFVLAELMLRSTLALATAGIASMPGCATQPPIATPLPATSATSSAMSSTPAQRLARYTTVKLVADESKLTPRELQMLPLLVDAARAMNDIFWIEAYGNRDSLMATISDPVVRQLVDINFGPWDRLDDNAPFVAGAGPRPDGANYYPRDMTKAEFESAVAAGGARADSLKGLYTVVRRDASGKLYAIPFHQIFAAQHQLAASKLRQAAALADDPGLRNYLTLRADALLTDNYQPSDFAWMDMKDNTLDIVVGPIETYEDALFGYKAAHEGVVLIKDREWSDRLAKYVALLPGLQRGIPVAEEYKRETPGGASDLNAYDVVYVSGQANTGAKTIAINLPNDEEVQLKKGARRIQLKNAVRAKFDRILLPIAQELIVPDQLHNVTFDAFFANVMFHEVSHGLGIKNTINGKGLVRTALKERYSALEEGKADILAMYMIRALNAQGQQATPNIADNYVTLLASMFRSVRFGATDSHGRANVVAFNFLQKFGAFTREPSGKYRVDMAKMRDGADSLSARILRIQGNGDYEAAGAFNAEFGTIGPQLQADLDRLGAKAIPVDIIYDQGS
ncbi:MAG: dipeptidyl-peptidase 3 family protein [Gemmatimonadaceae bacterium]